jgi:hypothetical protein
MTEEHEAVIHMRDMGFLHIQREFQLVFKERSTRFAHSLGVLSSSFDNDHKIIRVPAVGDGRFPLPVLSHSNRTLFENCEVPCPPILAHLLAQVTDVTRQPAVESVRRRLIEKR